MIRVSFCLPVLLLVALAGCGEAKPPTGKVSGRVVYGGAPVDVGTISFRNEAKGVVAGMNLGPDGGYDLRFSGGTDIPVGDYTVTVEIPEPHLPIASEQGSQKAELKAADYPNIPKKVRTPATSPLKTTVKEGTNTFDVDLKQHE
jgi:hypothetical protein